MGSKGTCGYTDHAGNGGERKADFHGGALWEMQTETPLGFL